MIQGSIGIAPEIHKELACPACDGNNDINHNHTVIPALFDLLSGLGLSSRLPNYPAIKIHKFKRNQYGKCKKCGMSKASHS